MYLLWAAASHMVTKKAFILTYSLTRVRKLEFRDSLILLHFLKWLLSSFDICFNSSTLMRQALCHIMLFCQHFVWCGYFHLLNYKSGTSTIASSPLPYVVMPNLSLYISIYLGSMFLSLKASLQTCFFCFPNGFLCIQFSELCPCLKKNWT